MNLKMPILSVKYANYFLVFDILLGMIRFDTELSKQWHHLSCQRYCILLKHWSIISSKI